MCQPGSRVLNRPGIGLTRRRGSIVTPARDPIPLAGWIAFIQANLVDWPSGTGFLEAREETCFTVLVGLDFNGSQGAPRTHADVIEL
ncbi:MAG: hypothetical protein HC767_12815 [Akkermansiaceae bacterium]|nr:hypothetical protein [Akkermansiaceae bacterium]